MINEGDFIEIEYTGFIEEDNEVFDTTSEKIARDAGIYSENGIYGSIGICVGQGYVLKGLEKQLVGKDLNKEVKIKVKTDDAFGKKDGKLLKLIASQKFVKQGVKPFPGLRVNIDNLIGVIRTVTGGRTIVDFNHPLAGKDLLYDVKIKDLVKDTKEKLNWILKMSLGINDAEITVNEKTARIKLKNKIPDEIQQKIGDKVKEIIKEITEIKFD
jgi:FKBP-type peptidyl-prolyl cis-trans isomerase 2